MEFGNGSFSIFKLINNIDTSHQRCNYGIKSLLINKAKKIIKRYGYSSATW
jgi:hypothetical protein